MIAGSIFLFIIIRFNISWPSTQLPARFQLLIHPAPFRTLMYQLASTSTFFCSAVVDTFMIRYRFNVSTCINVYILLQCGSWYICRYKSCGVSTLSSSAANRLIHICPQAGLVYQHTLPFCPRPVVNVDTSYCIRILYVSTPPFAREAIKLTCWISKFPVNKSWCTLPPSTQNAPILFSTPWTGLPIYSEPSPETSSETLSGNLTPMRPHNDDIISNRIL